MPDSWPFLPLSRVDQGPPSAFFCVKCVSVVDFQSMSERSLEGESLAHHRRFRPQKTMLSMAIARDKRTARHRKLLRWLSLIMCGFAAGCRAIPHPPPLVNWSILIVLRPLKARATIEREVPTHGPMVKYLTYYVRLGALRRKRHKGMRDGGATTVQR